MIISCFDVIFTLLWKLKYHLARSRKYGSPISRDLARFNSSLRDWILRLNLAIESHNWISRDFGCEICEIKKGSEVPNIQYFQPKITINFVMVFYISKSYLYAKILMCLKFPRCFLHSKLQIFNFLCFRFNLAISRDFTRRISHLARLKKREIWSTVLTTVEW